MAGCRIKGLFVILEESSTILDQCSRRTKGSYFNHVQALYLVGALEASLGLGRWLSHPYRCQNLS